MRRWWSWRISCGTGPSGGCGRNTPRCRLRNRSTLSERSRGFGAERGSRPRIRPRIRPWNAELLRAREVMDYLPVPQTLRTSALECVGQESGRATPSTRLEEGRCSIRYSLHSKDATSRRSAPSVARGWGCTLLTEPDGNSAEGASYRRSWVRKGKLATASPPPRP